MSFVAIRGARAPPCVWGGWGREVRCAEGDAECAE